MENALFEIKKNAVDHYFFVFRSNTDTVLASSKSFYDRASLEKCIAAIRETARSALIQGFKQSFAHPHISIDREASGYVFKITSRDGQQLISSICFAQEMLCIDSLITFMELAVEAKIYDLS